MAITATSRDTRSPKQVTLKALPLEQANFHNTSKNSGVDFLASVLTPGDPPCLFRITVCIDTAAVFKAKITKSANTQTVEFNSGAQLVAAALYIFDMLVHSGDTVNFNVDQNVTVQIFRVQEIVWGTQ